MVRKLRGATLLTIAGVIAALVPATSAGASTTESVVVQFRPGMPDEAWARLVGRAAAVVTRNVLTPDFAVVDVPAGRRAALAGLDGIVGVEPVQPMRMAVAPNDEHYGVQWHMSMVQAAEAQEIASGTGVTVAVLDTGIAYETFGAYVQAPDLAQTQFAPGWDFVSGDSHPNDDNGHGTHVAGTIAQSTGNGIGAIGVAPGATLMPIKVLDENGAGTDVEVSDGINWAVAHGADVINLSLGGGGSPLLREAIDGAVANGVTVVAASGNEGGPIAYPAAYDSVIAVGAVDFAGNIASYSNRGSQLDLVAPGGDLAADLNGDSYPDGVLQQTLNGALDRFCYCFYQGTSMATPHVAGAAAVLLASGQATTPPTVKSALMAAATDLGAAGFDNTFGNGLLRVRSSLAAVVPEAPVNVTASATDGSARVLWNAPPRDGGSARLEYRVSSGPTTILVDASANSTTVTGLDAGTSYSFTVAARNAVGWSAESVAASASPPPPAPPPPPVPQGYRFVASDGGIFSFGDAGFFGSPAAQAIPSPVVGMAKSTDGYWLVAANGGVYAYGAARHFGAPRFVTAPIVAMAVTSDGGGYWLAGADGAIYAFGNAVFHGGLGHMRLNLPIVGMAATSSGNGYWLVASDGGIFSFGDAGFFGSTGHMRLNLPIVGMTATTSSGGYWLVASDGGLFAFGDAGFYGSTGSMHLNKPVVGMAASPGGTGYWLVASDGGIFAFGTSGFYGSTGSMTLNRPIVGMTPA